MRGKYMDKKLAKLLEPGFKTIFALLILFVGVTFYYSIPVAVIEGIRRKPLNRKVEAVIHTAGLFVFLGLAILFDVLHFFG